MKTIAEIAAALEGYDPGALHVSAVQAFLAPPGGPGRGGGAAPRGPAGGGGAPPPRGPPPPKKSFGGKE